MFSAALLACILLIGLCLYVQERHVKFQNERIADLQDRLHRLEIFIMDPTARSKT